MRETILSYFRDKRALWALVALLAATAAVALALSRNGKDQLPAAETPEEVSASAAETEPVPTAEPTPEPTVRLAGKEIPADTEILTVKASEVEAGALEEAIAQLPKLTEVTVEGGYTAEERQHLRQTWPELRFIWPVELCGETFSSADVQISFAGNTDLTEKDLREIEERAGEFPELQTVELTDCGFESERLHELDEALGDVDVAWRFDIYDVNVCSTDEEVILSHHIIYDRGAELEEKMVWMPHLRRVEMAECQIRDSDMGALYFRHLPDVRIVWLVQIKWGGILTDSTYFIPYPESGAKQFPNMIGVNNLYYCPDLVALDLGHTNLKNLDFLDVMPNIKYLILADNWLRDIEKVGDLKELTWFEIFKTNVNDISPLARCTKLTDLNICYITAPGDNVYETVRQIKSLKRLWCCGTLMSKEQVESLRQELPDCEIWDKPGDESTGSTWRYSDSYYEMRDAFHMYYMSWDGNTVERLSEEEIAEVHKKFWGY